MKFEELNKLWITIILLSLFFIFPILVNRKEDDLFIIQIIPIISFSYFAGILACSLIIKNRKEIKGDEE